MKYFIDITQSRFIYVIAILAVLTGCTSVPTKSFDAFSKSVVQLHQGTDKALANIDDMSEARFLRVALQQTGNGDPSKVLELRIDIDPNDALAWRTKPLFLKIEQFRDGANQTTGALVSYSELLTRLASPDLLSTETFDKLTSVRP